MKKPLFLLVMLATGPATAAAACPDAPAWAQAFFRQHREFYADAPDAVLQKLVTPAFAKALRAEAAYADGEKGHLDYDPWLGIQDGDIATAPPPAFTAAPTDPNATAVSMTFHLTGDKTDKPRTARLLLRRDTPQACWRLDDFVTPRGDSLRRAYTAR